MFANNMDTILAITSMVTTCFAGYLLVKMMDEIFTNVGKKITNLNSENSELREKIEKLKLENEETRKNLTIENYEERICDLQSTVDSLKFQLDTKQGNASEDLIYENNRLKIRCDMLEQEIEKMRSKPKRVSKPIRTFNHNLRNLGFFDDEQESFDI